VVVVVQIRQRGVTQSLPDQPVTVTGLAPGLDAVVDPATVEVVISAPEATLATLRAHPGRLLIMFQPHGYGPIAKMGEQLVESFANGMSGEDRLFLPDPVYHGGTVERTRGSDWLAEQVRSKGGHAEHLPDRSQIGERLIAEAKPGDRILIMGARDDTLAEFARELVQRLAC